MSGQHPTWDDAEERALADRGAALIAAAVADTFAPQQLRERIEADRARGAARPTWRARRGTLLGGACAAVAAGIVAIVLATGGSTGGSGPSVLAVAALGVRAPAQPAPAEASRTLLSRSVQGVPFPNWNYRFQWQAGGARQDRVGGRPATTVFYDGPNGARLAYTIVAGDPLGVLEGARTVTVAGTRLWTLERDGRTIVTWERGGHTCVISAPASVPVRHLEALAAWKDAGSVPF